MQPDPTFATAAAKLLPVVRVLRALAMAGGDLMQAAAYAQARREFFTTPQVGEMLQKAVVQPVSTNDGIGDYTSFLGTAISEALRPLTVFGRLQPLMRRQPFKTQIVSSSGPVAARFVGEQKGTASPIPVAGLSFSEDGQPFSSRLMPARLALIVVLTADLIRESPQGTDAFIANELLRGLIAGLDAQFIDPSRAYDSQAGAPASITSGNAKFNSTGTSISAIDNDLGLLVNSLVTAGCDLSSAVWIMSPVSAVALARKRGTGGAAAFPDVGGRGGALLGLPVVVSSSCAAGGSPGEFFVSLIEASQLTYGDDNGASIDWSEAAALQMNDAPSAGAQPLRSLWQNGLSACRVTLWKNWIARPGSTATLENVVW